MSVKILVAEDSAADRLFIKSMLEEYTVLTAADGLEAMEQVKEHRDIALVILDLHMPNMDGFQFLNALNAEEFIKIPRTIILTNYDELENEIRGLELGAVDYIRKPINIASLKARIQIHLELLRIQNLFEQQLYERSMMLDTIFHQSPIGIAISFDSEPYADQGRVFISINSKYEQITGRSKEELLQLGWAKITHPDDVAKDLHLYKQLLAGKINSYSIEKRYIRPDGSIVWVLLILAPLDLSNEYKYNHICLVQDITERKMMESDLQESERSKSVLLANLPGLAYRLTVGREITMQFVSDGALDLTGYSPERLLNDYELAFKGMLAPEYVKTLNEKLQVLSDAPDPLEIRLEYEIITASGERKWVMTLGEGIFDEKGVLAAIEGIIIDIDDKKKMENDLKYNAEHDQWTGLPNRRFLQRQLISDAGQGTAEKRALLKINLSTVQSLALTFGFQYSQNLMKKVADTLRTHCTDQCQLYYTHQNLFVFYLKGYEDKNALVRFCETIINTLESLLVLENIGGGIGVVEIDQENEQNIDRILKNLMIASEKAMHFYDRDIGTCFFDSNMEAEILWEEKIQKELIKIVGYENGASIFMQYQPILDLKTNQICGFEALARLKTDEMGLVAPDKIVTIAEKSKLIIPIGEKIFQQALHFLKRLEENGYNKINVSINISAIQLLRNDFTQNLLETIEKMQVDPQNVTLEITESVIAPNYKVINDILNELTKHGLQFSIDDFGTGYSSLARERSLNVDSVKIDKFFIDQLMTTPSEKTITNDIISIAHKMGHHAIAEGVEHEEQRQYLLVNGCEKIQGFLISEPLDEDEAMEFLRQQMNTNGCRQSYGQK